ncbi:MAG: GTP-binding protein [Methanoregula sp.]
MSGIDELLGGGIRKGSRVLYSLEPGVDGQLFTLASLYEAQKQGLSCLVIIPQTTVDAFLHDAGQMTGHPLDPKNHRLFFIDSVDRERMQRSTGKNRVSLDEWKARIGRTCTENHIDVIFGYFDVISEDFGVEDGLTLLSPVIGGKHITLIIEHLNLQGSCLIETFINRYAFDLVIAIRSSSRPLPLFNYFTVINPTCPNQQRRSIPFVIRDGRVVPYIPKIVVTGPPESGKSTFVASATQKGQSIDRAGLSGGLTTVAMDFGWLHWKDFDITVYGTPGQPRFDPMLPVILRNAMGVILLLDGTNPDQLARGRTLYDQIKKMAVPLTVAINKKDLPDLLLETDIRRRIGIKKEVPVFVISAQDRSDVRAVIEALVESITRFVY